MKWKLTTHLRSVLGLKTENCYGVLGWLSYCKVRVWRMDIYGAGGPNDALSYIIMASATTPSILGPSLRLSRDSRPN